MNESLVSEVIGEWSLLVTEYIGGCSLCFQIFGIIFGLDNFILSAINHSSN